MDDTFSLDSLLRRNVPIRRLDAGETVFLEHDIGREMYVVVSGRIDVLTYGRVLEHVGLGGLFGEMALIDAGPRSAAALAAEPSEVVVIDGGMFGALVREEPGFAMAVMSTLVRRLRRRED
jgi:CRP/FNR family transcriptional regulator, cyclic AMP receptor protein